MCLSHLLDDCMLACLSVCLPVGLYVCLPSLCLFVGCRLPACQSTSTGGVRHAVRPRPREPISGGDKDGGRIGVTGRPDPTNKAYI